MADLFLELFSEEIPARLQLGAEENLKKLVSNEFLTAKLSFSAAESFSTPRRLILVVTGLPQTTSSESEEKRGPSVVAPKQAIDGFCKSMNISRSQLFTKMEKKGEFYFTLLTKKSQPSADIIEVILSKVVKNFPWPKSMRSGSGSFKWVRPLRSVVCILSAENESTVLPLKFDTIVASNICFGHRFMAPGGISISSYEDYQNKMSHSYVILDRNRRKTKIWNEAQNAAFAMGLELVDDQSLLEEVTGLVEWPVVLIGKIDQVFLDLPPEVLQVSMRVHQKFFSLKKKGSETIEAFIVVANVLSTDDGKSVIEGNERVLSARLSDAKFFWENDLRNIDLNGYESFAQKLNKVIFHNKLGTESERVIRITTIAASIARMLDADLESTKIAASLCKLDLVSEMVYEFPELQGAIGRRYAEKAGFQRSVSDACFEHYLPKGPLDEVPQNSVSICIALADKIDMVSNFWSIGLKPTGSKDPFALRRAAIGIIRILLENDLDLSLCSLLKLGNSNLDFNDLINFFNDRLRSHFIEKNIRFDVINSINLETFQSVSMKTMYLRALAVQEFVSTQAGKDLIQGYKRAVNILNVEENRDGVEYSDEPRVNLIVEKSEALLHQKLLEISKKVISDLEEKNSQSALQNLSTLRHPIDTFFNDVQINIDDAIVRKNRLCLLNQIKKVMHHVAVFSKIDGEL